MAFEPIAIVGRGCVLPGALDAEALWAAARDGLDLVTSPPADRWRLSPGAALSTATSGTVDRASSDRGGTIHGAEAHLAGRAQQRPYGVPWEELAGLDPLVHFLLDASRQALDEAGVEGSARVGAVIGSLGYATSAASAHAEAFWRARNGLSADPVDPRNRFHMGWPVHVLGRALGVSGPRFALDAACASSLYAISAAADLLHDRRADVVLAGAVNRSDDLFLHVGFTALGAMSKTGQSRPFHAEADGLLPAEGSAVVALMRLADARRSGRSILGVIRGIGLANDGRGRGLLVPMSEGQVRAMRQAWHRADLDPRTVGLVECHATGTVLGDGTELESLRAVFGDAADVPLGSLKGNLGHLITAAGGSALIKVLGALRDGIRPPTLHVERPHPGLVAPLRVLTASEPWPDDVPRRAAIDAFGFGGNDAHLIVEAHDPDLGDAGVPVVRVPVAIVGMGAAVGDGHGVDAWCDGEAGRRAKHAILPLAGLKFPPADLAASLGQQTRLLEATVEAIGALALPRERTGVWVGAQSDPTTSRYGLRWRLADEPAEASWTQNARDAAMPPLDAASVVGHMPNIPANRIGSQFDLAGLGFVIAAEERSGTVALDLACRALAAGEVDFAVVGATDLSCEPAHASAVAAVLQRAPPGDAAICLVLRRAADVEAGDVLALIDDRIAPVAHLDVDDIGARWGHAHAASGLLAVAWAALGDAPCEVEVTALDGPTDHIRVAPRRRPTPSVAQGPFTTVACHRPEVVLPPSHSDVLPLAPPLVAPPATSSDPAWPAASASADHWRVAAAPPPATEPTLPVAPSPTPPPLGAPMAAPAPLAMAQTWAAPQRPGSPLPAHLAATARQIGAVHAHHVAQLSIAHAAFLHARAEQTALLLRVRGGAPMPSAGQPSWIAPPTPAALPAEPVPTQPPQVAPPAVLAVPPPAPKAPAAPALARLDPSTLPGPRFDRAQLEHLASGRISELFGERFAPQDGHDRQVRMPEPPLLLADRVLGIRGEPASMGLGTIWTETDITADSWYLHDGAMPAGVLIESGQADLLLISWLGIDLHNRGERVYRLLGCDLTYRSRLPGPGTTLRYEIHVDGHAKHGDIRLFFFHYDCVARDGGPILQVRNGQAGFFTDAELDDSGGILWSPEEAGPTADSRVDAPALLPTRTHYDRTLVESFGRGDAATTFGPGYEWLSTHVRTPRISGPPMLFFSEVTHLNVEGGPWGRGYLRAVHNFSPDDWFFKGHFKGDPCMPGTLMFEGCLHAMAFYATSLGATLRRDGWKWEPVPDVTYPLRCRGQAIPSSKELVYEVFVDGYEIGEHTVLWADLLCTIDGLKAFHAKRVGIRLVPDFPISSRPDLLDGYVEPKPVAVIDGFPFDYKSLMACAWGPPSQAFGAPFGKYDQGRHVARLPGPPYHFMSRVLRIEGKMGDVRAGALVELEYDIPESAWYFDEMGSRTMPFAVLLEAALQPCGWLAVFVGSALNVEHDLFFRNLDGNGVLHQELLPSTGTLRTVSRLKSVSNAAGMIVESFEVHCYVGDVEVYTLDTVFGFFPRESLANQVGIVATDEERARLAEPSDVRYDIVGRDFGARAPALPGAKLMMIDRITGLWPTGGVAGLGRVRAEKDVDPNEWFFKAHFYTDPVQPGSLGLEAMLQALMVFMADRRMGEGLARPRFEPIGISTRLKWKYRGQVVPRNKIVAVDLDIVEIQRDERGVTVVANGYLWVDGLRIYGAEGMAMRLVDGDPADGVHLDPTRNAYVADHAPTWTIPALPAMELLDRLVPPGARSVRDFKVLSWVPAPVDLRVEGDATHRTLIARHDGEWRQVASARFDAMPSAPPNAWRLRGLSVAPDPYAAGTLFHGPSLQALTGLRIGAKGSVADLDLDRLKWPPGAWSAGLLDAATHGIPHDALSKWFDDVPDDVAAYPIAIPSLDWFAAPPTSGRATVVARPVGRVDPRTVAVEVQILVGTDVVAQFLLHEILVPKGPVGRAEPLARRAFLTGHATPGVGLATTGATTVLRRADVVASDWLPGTVASVYGTPSDATSIAVREHAAAPLGLHPRDVAWDGHRATTPTRPFHHLVARVETDLQTVRVDGTWEFDARAVRGFWDAWFRSPPWPVEDLIYGLIRRYVGDVIVADPAALHGIAGRSALVLANHQVGIESLIGGVVAGALLRGPTVTVAKVEHRESWLGSLIRENFEWPGTRDPDAITFFDRADPSSLPALVERLSAEMVTRRPRHVMVHVEGTRSTSCAVPVSRMSGTFVDMAVERQLPIVPLRFVGGLPREPVTDRLEFPVAHGRQTLIFGAPILPETLSSLPYKDRKGAVIDALNALGPGAEFEQPGTPDPAFEQSVRTWQAERGVPEVDAVMAQVLVETTEPSEDTRRLVDAMLRKRPLEGDDPVTRWLQRAATRFGGRTT